MRMLKNEIMIFDSHFHMMDARFPLVANQGYLPNNFTCADYLERARKLKIAGGAIVSGSFQAFDQNYLVAAIEDLGPTFVGRARPARARNRRLACRALYRFPPPDRIVLHSRGVAVRLD